MNFDGTGGILKSIQFKVCICLSLQLEQATARFEKQKKELQKNLFMHSKWFVSCEFAFNSIAAFCEGDSKVVEFLFLL